MRKVWETLVNIELVEPSVEQLSGYVAALESGWSPNTTRDVSGEQLATIREDADSFETRGYRGEIVRRRAAEN